MHVQTVRADDGLTLLVTGEVDLATCVDLREIGEKTVQQADGLTLRLDLAGVGFIDSSGIGSLIAIRNAADLNQVRLVVANPSPKVVSVLEITRLIDVFTIEDDLT